jgi:addiction module RelE/StbE family toxin
MASVTWTPKAQNDLQAAYEYIARDSRRLAEAFVLRVEAAVDRLAAFPESGRMVPEFRRRDIREVIVQRYRVFYRIRAGNVEVLSVLHGARDIRASDLPLPDDA